ncbi:MAG: aspartate kinase [Bacteroidales bacterium]|nr:aspartate kinase [Bacteroidales bacterium]
MQVFKFGGATIKDAQAVERMGMILERCHDPLVIVISAMGKTTNALEKVVASYMSGKIPESLDTLKSIQEYHTEIASELTADKNDVLFGEIDNIFAGLQNRLHTLPPASYNEEYDQIVSWGEILSTLIVSHYLNHRGIINQWIDARQILKTDSNFREGRIDWDISSRLVIGKIDFTRSSLFITQGFIGSTVNNLSTTLGREGSDYTAAVLAYILNADSVTVWKDVPGVLNADPKWFDSTVRLEKISYLDAIELTYYGTSVIHPKTIQPLKNKNIPLYVKSFLNPDEPGTVIGRDDYERLIPSFIFKMDQVLIHIHPPDYSFIAEENLEIIFNCFAGYGLKINLMQNSAVSFDVCVNNDQSRIPSVIKELEKHFRVRFTNGLELITIRYYDHETIDRVLVNKDLLLTQRTKTTIQMVVKDLG